MREDLESLFSLACLSPPPSRRVWAASRGMRAVVLYSRQWTTTWTRQLVGVAPLVSGLLLDHANGNLGSFDASDLDLQCNKAIDRRRKSGKQNIANKESFNE
jgi:hypothetical protein